jgi:tol-pal system protein YbgF
MRSAAPAVSLVALVALGGAGCARSAEERQLDSMRAEIDRIQDERDQADRSMLAGDPDSRPGAAPAESRAGAPPPAAGRPAVRVGAGDDAQDDEYADPEDTAPRPRIRVLGTPRVGGRYVEQVEDDGAQPSNGPPTSTVLDPQAKHAYDAAMAMVGAKQYDQALEAFAAFLVKWPDHPYADHAMYWRGECYFAKGDFQRARDQFEGVFTRFPAGSKAPDALLKLGMTYQRLGDAARARECFERLATEFPQTEAARRVPREGHP